MNYNGAFKNYRSQLNGWALAQALDYWKSCPPYTEQDAANRTPEALQALATKLADYAYTQEADFDDLIKRLGDVLKADEDPIAKADMLIDELEFLKEQMGVQKAKLAAAN